MAHPRITMADVARHTGVHQTTVSLALRNDPRLPRETRQRIRSAARAMGYRPDPLLSALNIYRSSRSGAGARPPIAFITRSRPRRWDSTFYSDDQFLRGARRAAERLGYRLVLLQAGNSHGEGPRLSRVIRSMGIGGVVVAGLDISLRSLDVAWEHFCAVCIESQHLALPLTRVGNNQTGVTRTAVRRAAALGYRSIGLAVGEVEEISLGKAFSAGYWAEVHEIAGLKPVPPLLMHAGGAAPALKAWIREHQVDAVLSNWNLPDTIRSLGYRIPRDIGVATLDHNPSRGASAGMRQSHDLVGERALEALSVLMKTNQRGAMRLPGTTLIDGVWRDGPELVRRRAARGI